MKNVLYQTKQGKLLVGDSIDISNKYLKKYYKNKFQLIITSPPFPLNAKNGMETSMETIIWNGLLV